MVNYYFDYPTHSDYNKNPFFYDLLKASQKEEVMLLSVDGSYPKLVNTLASELNGNPLFDVSSTRGKGKKIYFTRKKDDPNKKHFAQLPTFQIDTNFTLGHESIQLKSNILVSVNTINKGILNYISESDIVNIFMGCLKIDGIVDNLINAFPRYREILEDLRYIDYDFFDKDSYLVLSNDKRQVTPKIITIKGYTLVSTSDLTKEIADHNQTKETTVTPEIGGQDGNFLQYLEEFKTEILTKLEKTDNYNDIEDLTSEDSLAAFRE